MKKSDLFSPDLRMNLPRNFFPLEHGKKFSLAAGLLQPCLCEEMLIGDRFECRTSSIVRTLPLNTTAFAKVDVNFDFFFVPSRLLYSQFPQWFQRMPYNTNPDVDWNDSFNTLKKPFCLTLGKIRDYLNGLSDHTSTDDLGYSVFTSASRLFSLLGYGTDAYIYNNNSFKSAEVTPFVNDDTWRNTEVSALPLFAYNRIYQDFYRDPEWEEADYRFANMDHIVNNDLDLSDFSQYDPFRLHYCKYKKDYFMGLHAHMQYGDQAIVDTLNYGQVGGIFEKSFSRPYEVIKGATGDPFNLKGASPGSSEAQIFQAGFDIYSLRLQQSLQHWREVYGSTPYHYRALVKAMTGVDVPDELSNAVEFVDGFSQVLNIDEVISTSDSENQQSSSSLGQIAGRGISVYRGDKLISYTAKEPGFFMCILYIRPEIDYPAIGINPQLFHVEREDYYDEIQDRIGYAPVWMYTLDQTKMDNIYSANFPLGFGDAYLEYKTKVTTLHGTFNGVAGQFNSWTVPYRGVKSGQYMGYIDMLVDPACLDFVFTNSYGGRGTSDQFLCNVWFDLKAARNMSGTTLP